MSFGNIDLGHVDLTVGKGVQLQSGWETDQTGDLACGIVFGIDDDVNAQMIAQKIVFTGIFGIADTGDGVRRAQAFGHHTADHVEFVRVGHGDEEVCVFYARLDLNGVAGTVALYALHVVLVDDAVDQSGIFINDGNAVALA